MLALIVRTTAGASTPGFAQPLSHHVLRTRRRGGSSAPNRQGRVRRSGQRRGQLEVYPVGIAEGEDRESGVSKVVHLAVGDAGVVEFLVRGDEVLARGDLEADVVQTGVHLRARQSPGHSPLQR